jgi:hypothetical protein
VLSDGCERRRRIQQRDGALKSGQACKPLRHHPHAQEKPTLELPLAERKLGGDGRERQAAVRIAQALESAGHHEIACKGKLLKELFDHGDARGVIGRGGDPLGDLLGS